MVVSAGALAARTADLIDLRSSSGYPVVVLHGGAVEAAEIALELQERGLEPLLQGGPVEFVHRSGGLSALRSAAQRTAHHEDGTPCLLVVHPLVPDTVNRYHPCVCSLVEDERAVSTWSSTVCLFGAPHAATAGLAALFRHPVLQFDGIEVRLTHHEGQILALDMLLEALDDPAAIHQLAMSPAVKELDRASVERLVDRRLSGLPAIRTAVSVTSTQPFSSMCDSMCAAVMRTDGRIDEVLEAGRGYLGTEVLLEDAGFRPVAWLPKTSPPSSLSELITPGRLSRLASRLEPGVPERVRLGTPSAGHRLVVRIGTREFLGYLSGNAPDSDVPGAVTWLRHVAPLLAAEMARRGRWRTLRSESRRQLVTLLVQGLLSPESARMTMNHLVGPEGVRVAALSPPVGAHLPAGVSGAYNPDVVVRSLDRLGVAHGEHLEMIVALLPGGDQAAGRLVDELATQPVTVGLGSIVHDPVELPTSARQAAWTCRIALATRQRMLDFAGIGVHRLLMPGAEAGDPVFEEPIERLEACRDELGFDGTSTVAGYLDAGGNMRRAAEQLAVHVNTLRYRLQRTSEVMNVDLADPEQRFRLQLAMRLRAGRRALRESGDTDWAGMTR
jgi:hypothetical protein